MGKSSGGSGGAQTVNSTTTNIPEYARPYFENVMERARSTSEQPYSQYEGQGIADMTPMQQASYQGLANYGGNQGYYDAASQYGTGAGDKFGNFNATRYNSPVDAQSGIGSIYDNWNKGGGAVGVERTSVGMWDKPTADKYADPYMQNVVDIQKREANRDYGVQNQQLQSNMVNTGSFGGTRQAIRQSEGDRNQQQLLGDIQQKGSESAYRNAQEQFERDREAGFKSDFGNAERAAQVGLGNAANWRQIIGMGENARQFNTSAMMDTNKLNQQGEALNLDAAKGQAGVAQMLGQLGGQNQSDYFNYMDAMNRAGQQQQGWNQQNLDYQRQQFDRQQAFPREMLDFYSGILRGVPVSANSTSSSYGAGPSGVSQAAGIGALALQPLMRNN